MKKSEFDKLMRDTEKPREPKPKTKPATAPKGSANGLTKAIVGFINKTGGFATRISSTGTFRADIKKFVRPTQTPGIPDIAAVFAGRSVWVEVKIGKDRMSDAQIETRHRLEKAGAAYIIAHDFDGFIRDWDAIISQK